MYYMIDDAESYKDIDFLLIKAFGIKISAVYSPIFYGVEFFIIVVCNLRTDKIQVIRSSRYYFESLKKMLQKF